ncbi:PRC-barrel domain-containing protein [Cellulomonas massiliensis]|uniref:PRC-barrel domain-containing protein n=1 Tax=Cellulomonas massiliensis TaxID=1465811 RepID=UPI0002F42B42|nr:hypothetical protein [Cellulomonas massiliensis]
MILGDLLDAHVRDDQGRRLGYVVDVRLVLDRPASGLLAVPRVHGLLVSPRTSSSFLGYERRDVRAPALLARWLRRRHRGTFLVLWPDVERLGDDEVVLRTGYRRWSPVLDA